MKKCILFHMGEPAMLKNNNSPAFHMCISAIRFFRDPCRRRHDLPFFPPSTAG